MKHLLLLLLMGHPSFQVREQASAVLKDDWTAGFVMEAASEYGDPEIRHRAERIMLDYDSKYRLDAFQSLIGTEPLPYLDSMPAHLVDFDIFQVRSIARDDPSLRKYWVGVYGQDRAATAVWLKQKLKEGKEWKELKQILDTMKDRSANYDMNGLFSSP